MRLTVKLTLEEYRWLREQKGSLKMAEYVRKLIKEDAKRENVESKKTNIWGKEKEPRYRFSWEEESGSLYEWSDKNLF